MVDEYGKVMAFSANTLFNGDNLGLQTYSVVRFFDYIAKVLIDFLNHRAFEKWNTKTEKELRIRIIKFLDGIQGPDRLIEKFRITRFERDPKQKDRIYLDLHIMSYFPAKSFIGRNSEQIVHIYFKIDLHLILLQEARQNGLINWITLQCGIGN